ncbi:PKD domain-containing protein [Flavobacterium sp. F-65]|uniref:PKD domain-containing protein n=1 Tax=Flavobacterium pisciphilum TaxID=2893755 RepID=A0ABS8MQV7_9FLAO|nr:PKD domain-containing protein [Flavobacterium sp. F-65]MCC9071140.1 PKD domain-containing protein [Flavobacterium sp. F-65]
MGKHYFLHLYFLLIITTSVYGFGTVNKSDFTTNKAYKNLVLAPNVDFNFTNDGTCSGTPITFNPIVTGTAPFTYKWDFGDGSTSTDNNPSHSFTAVGCGLQSFTVTLTVTDATGVNTATKTVSVKQKPDLKFVNGGSTSFERCGDNNSSPKYTINVVNNSGSIGCITSYNVNWGDGSSETNVTFPKAHEYQKLGSFNMVITAVGNGCNNSVTYVVKNSNNPLGALIAPGNTTNLCIPVAPMDFAIGAWGLNPSDTNYLVNYGDGTVLNFTQGQLESSTYYNAANPQASQNFPVPHKFTSANCPSGNTVSLTISTSCGRTYLTAGPIIILDVPVISFNVNSIVCANTYVNFNNTTRAGYTNDCSTYNVYTWDFGDGTFSREVSPVHVYTTPGTYTIKLNATTPCGVGTETTRTICVEPILQPKFTYGNACASTNVQMINTTDTSLGCGTESYYWEVTYYYEGYCGKGTTGQWNFADGTNSYSKNPVFNFAKPGSYNVQLRTTNSCGVYNYSSQLIPVKKKPVITLKPISDFCNSATINPVGTVEETCSPSSEITYEWSFPGGTPSSSTLLNPGPINYTTSGNYEAIFRVTNSCGTTEAKRPFSVDLVLSPIIKDKSVKTCSGTGFQVTPVTNGIDNVPAGTTYVWSTPVVSPAGAVSGASGQSSPRTTISQTLINNTANPATVTYTVSPISTVCPGPNFTITVIVDPLINVVDVTKNSTCYGSNDASIAITVTGGIPFATGNPYTFSWTGPNGFTSTDKDISNLKPGSYNLRINDNGNCPYSRTYYVNEPGKFQFSGGKNDITCFGLNNGYINLSVSGGTLPYKYVWTKDGNPYTATAGNINNLASGVYGVTITEANNCDILTGSYIIIEPPLLKVSFESQVNILCYGYYTGEINVSTVGGRYTELSPGVFNYRYSWTGPNGFRSNLQNPKNLAAGTYDLTVTDNSGCTDKLRVVLLQNDEIRLNYSKTEIACYNYSNASITINSITGGVPFTTGEPYIIEWSNLGTGLVQNNLSAGTYIITITDSLGCPKVFTIVIDNAPVFTINPDVMNVSCFGANDGHIRLNLVGGKAPVKLVWDDNSTAGIERNNIGPGKYSVTITDAKSCVIKETFIIIEPLLLELRADVSNPLDCVDANTGEINLVVTGGLPPFSYSWSNGAKTEDLTKLPPGTYAVTVTDANGCKKSEEWKITRFDQLTPTIEVLTDFNCDTKYVHQTFVGHVKGGIPPYTLSWSDGVVSGPNNEIMNTENKGLIIFSVTDSFGCTADFPYNVNTPVLGIANYSTSSYGKDVFDLYSIYDPILFTNLATGDFTNISWDFGDGKFSNEENPKHIYTREGTYTIKQTVTYPFGCQYSYTSTIVVEKGYSLIMPNAFTPNNDGYNDTFAPVFLGFDSITLDVYDTWGGIVYSETGKNIRGWDGQIKNHAAENGNYFFKITAKTFYNHTITEKGAFTLLK